MKLIACIITTVLFCFVTARKKTVSPFNIRCQKPRMLMIFTVLSKPHYLKENRYSRDFPFSLLQAYKSVTMLFQCSILTFLILYHKNLKLSK